MNDFCKNDTVKGTVIKTKFRGVNVKLDGIDAEGFCECSMQEGDVGLFTIKGFIQTADSLRITLTFDSVLENAPEAC